MDPKLWWVLLVTLTVLLVFLLAYLCFSVISDYCLQKPRYNTVSTNETKLNKYRFNKNDVEDLTRIENDFKTVLPHVTCVNEVDKDDFEGLMKRKLNTTQTDHDISLSTLSENNSTQLEITEEEHEESDDYKSKRPKQEISQSVDNLEFCDPRGLDTLKVIHKIKDRAEGIEKEIECFVGGERSLKYYEINEKFIRCMIDLSDVMCYSAELRVKKNEALAYVESCQKKLKARAQLGE